MGLKIQQRWLVSLILANAYNIPIKCKILTEIIFLPHFFSPWSLVFLLSGTWSVPPPVLSRRWSARAVFSPASLFWGELVSSTLLRMLVSRKEKMFHLFQGWLDRLLVESWLLGRHRCDHSRWHLRQWDSLKVVQVGLKLGWCKFSGVF